MALKYTPICDFGWQALDFSLPATDGKTYTLADCVGEQGLVVVFGCNHCPYVKSIIDRLIEDAETLQALGVAMVMINPNDAINYPEDSFENMQQWATEKNFPFPYLHDENQQVAKAWDAVCTPDFFGFDKDLKLQYRGRLDDSGRETPNPSSKRELIEAMKTMLATGQGPAEQTPSMGCSIKWKLDNYELV